MPLVWGNRYSLTISISAFSSYKEGIAVVFAKPRKKLSLVPHVGDEILCSLVTPVFLEEPELRFCLRLIVLVAPATGRQHKGRNRNISAILQNGHLIRYRIDKRIFAVPESLYLFRPLRSKP